MELGINQINVQKKQTNIVIVIIMIIIITIIIIIILRIIFPRTGNAGLMSSGR